MAVKSTWMDTARNNAKAQDERDKQASIIRQQNIKNQQSAQIASRLDNPINSPSVQAKQSAKIAANLDNSLINKATQGTTNPAEMYRPGNVTESLFKTPNYVSNGAMAEMVDRANARWALQQDNTAVEKAREATRKSTEQQKAAMERMVSALYQKMEGYKNNGQTDELFKAEQEYAKLNDSIAQMNSKIHGSAMEEAADWETRRYNEIMATGGRTLMANLEQLVELSDRRISEADDERKNGLTETQKQYNALYKSLTDKYGSKVDGWLEYAKRAENKSQMALRTVQAKNAAENHPFWASVGSVPLNLASGAGYMDVLGQKLQRFATGSDAPIDYNSPAQSASKMTNTIRGTVSEGMGGVGKFLYNTGMSMADSLVVMPMGNFGMALLGGSAATNAMQAAIERGASDDQALKIGILAGAIEAALEKTSIDSLFNLTDSKTVADFFTNAFKQSGAELTEEGLTKLGNTFADAVIMGNKSELNTAKRDYIADGYSPEKAEGMALKDWGVDLLLDMAGGALSGFLFGSFKSGFDVVRNGGFQKPTVESVMPKPKQETQAQPPVADITPTPQQEAAKPIQQQTETEVEEPPMMPGYGEVQDDGILVYRGYNRSTDGKERNLARMRGIGDVLGRDIGPETELLPLVYYTDSMEDAEGYAKHDLSFFEMLKEKYGEEQALETYKTLTGRDEAKIGEVLEHRINPKKVMDLTELGEQTNTDAVYKLLSRELGIPERLPVSVRDQMDMDSYLEIGDPDGDSYPTYMLLKNKSGILSDDAGSRVLELLREFGYDAIKYKEDGANHYAVVSDDNQDAPKQENGQIGKIRPGRKVRAKDTGEYYTVTKDNGDGSVDLIGSYAWDTPTYKISDLEFYGYEWRNRKQEAKPAMGDIGDMGAKTSDFLHEVKESQSKTTPRYYEQNNIPEEGRADNHYTERTWAEARHNANVSLEQDYDGEVDDLTRKTVWSDEDSFKAEIILEDIHKKARETGDWSEHQKWSKVFAQHKEELGRAFSALRGLHKNTVETIIADASASLENAVKGTDANAVMREVDEYAVRYEKASETKNVDGLLEIIRDTSVTRKTGTRKGGLSKEIDWALKRVADYARAELAAGKQAGTLEAGKFYDFLQNFAANGIKAIATDKQKISFGQGYRTIQHNSILSKFLTIMRNLVNNGVLDPLDSFSGNLVIPLDSLLSKYTKTRSVAYDKSWFSEVKRKGSLDGMAMALLEIGLDVNGDGKAGKYEDVGKRTFHMANGGIAKFISAWEKYSGYVMGATDEFTKGGVRDEVQRGIDSLYEQNKIKDDTLRNAGEQAALYRTLQDETIPSKIVTGTRRALNHAQIGGLGLGDVTIKFAQVPANLPARAADFSPVGLVRGLGKMAKVLIDAKNGKLTAAQQASAVKDIGRGITGSGLILASTALALKGIIHVVAPGGEDENKDKAAAEQAQGLKETQLNLSALLRSIKGEDTTRRYGDKMVSFGFLDPINAHLMTGALIAEDIEEAKKAGEKIGLGDVLTDSLQGTIHALLDLPLMDPINDIRYAWQKSDGDNEVEKAWDVVKQGVAGEVTSFIPNVLKGIAQGIDPYQRDMYSKDDLVGRTVDQIVGGIPGLRQTLPIKQDVYGNDIKNPEQPLNFLNANILPGAITTYTETDLQRVLNDLSEQSGKNSMYLSKDAPKSITVDGEEFKLTKAQQTKFMAERGDIYEAASAALENNETYQNFSIDWKVQAYAEAENYAVQTAKDGLGTKFDPADWVKDLEGASPEEFAEAMVQRVVESMAEKAGENKYLGLETLLENKSIDDQMALSCMSTSCYDAYTANCEKADISVQQFLDAYGTAQASGESNAEKKQAALDYIAGLDISAKQKGALAQAVHEAIGSFIPQDTQLPDQWLIDIGDTNKIVSQMSTDQRQKYNTYVKDSGIKMQMYLDAKEYKDNYDPVSNHGIEAPAAFYEYVTSLGIGSDKAKALYLGFYAESTWEKQVKKHKK